MKKFAISLMLCLAGPALAQTQLSSSTTFQNALNAKANKSGDTFTGNVTVPNLYSNGSIGILGDSQFYLANIYGYHGLNVANGVFMTYNPNVGWSTYVNSSERLRVDGNGVKSPGTIAAIGTSGSSEGLTQLESSHDTTHTGYVSFYAPGQTQRIGYLGYGVSSGGLNFASDVGSINISPAGAPNPMIVGKDSNGKLQIVINNLPTGCSGEPQGTIYVNGGYLHTC